VRRTPAEDVVEFLNFSSDPFERANRLGTLSVRQWEHVLEWLNDAGLAFYFLHKLKTTDTTCRVPSWVMSRLEGTFAANQQRVSDMSVRFAFLNQRFNNAGVRYAVLKGLSHVPQFCPQATLRYQADFDYLIDDKSLFAAQNVLLQAGYSLKLPHTSQEFIFLPTQSGESWRNDDQYAAGVPHAVELHLDIWDRGQYKLPPMPRLFLVERTSIHLSNGFAFPALADEDAFLLQVLHTYLHSVTYWIRMSWLFEIGYFLHRRASDTSLWNRIEERVGDNLVLRDLVVIITELVSKLFAPRTPSLVRNWGRMIRPGPRIWIENYARHWAFSEAPIYRFCFFPRAKLVLFLHKQYADPNDQNHSVRHRLLPSTRLSSIATALRDKPSLLLHAGWWKRQLLIRRGPFSCASWAAIPLRDSTLVVAESDGNTLGLSERLIRDVIARLANPCPSLRRSNSRTAQGNLTGGK
jgi:hypothetical protein